MVDIHAIFDLQSMWIKADQILKDAGNAETSLTGWQHRVVFCDLLLAELKKFQGRELEPFLGNTVFDVLEQSYKLTLCFPGKSIRSGATTVGEVEPDDTGSSNNAAG